MRGGQAPRWKSKASFTEDGEAERPCAKLVLSLESLEQPGRILGFLARAPSGHIDLCYSWLDPKEGSEGGRAICISIWFPFQVICS